MNIYKFPFQIDVSGIYQEVLNNPNCWNFDRSSETLEVQQHTKTIPLRSGKRRRAVRLWDSHEYFDTILVPYFPMSMGFVSWFEEKYGGECGRIAIVKLPSEKKVYPHIDYGDYYRKRDRFHLVLNGMYEYNVGNEREIFSAGDLFWFESQKTHHTRNMSDVDRLVLIFDMKDSKFREIMQVDTKG